MRRLFYLLVFTLVVINMAIGQQQDTLRIEIIAGNEESLQWELLNQNYQVVNSQLYSVVDSQDLTIDTFIVQSLSDCHIFKFYPNELFTTSSLRLYVNGVQLESDATDPSAPILINCKKGNTCINPIEIPSIPYSQSIPIDTNDVWFCYRPRVTKLFQVLSCTEDEMLPDKFSDTDLWIYQNCDNIPFDGPQSAIAVSIDNGCGDVNAVKLTKTEKFFFRVRNNEANPHNIDFFLDLSDSIRGCTDLSACNFDPFSRVDDGSCYYGLCQPDLALASIKESIFLDTFITQDQCYVNEGCLAGLGERHVIRFGTEFGNIGNADYIVGEAAIDNPAFSFDNCHNHWHKLDYAEYLLFNEDSKLIPSGFKNGFCVLDLNCNTGSTGKYNCDYMGVSVGCSDLYSANLDCQWIDVTDIPDGKYTLVNRVNWTRLPDLRGLEESNYENNWVQACIEIDRSSGELELHIFDDCPVYRDCLGVAYGNTAIDCAGVCGGTSHFGDVNGDMILDQRDVRQMWRDILESNLVNSPCFDLNNDGLLTLYDVALLQQCVLNNQDSLAEHSHCNFPTGFLRNDTMAVEISNLEQGSFYLSYLSDSLSIQGLVTSFENITIDSVVALDSTLIGNIEYTANEISVLIPPTAFLPSNNEMTPILKVFISDIMDATACLSQVRTAIGQDYSLMQGTFREQCIISDTDDMEIFKNDFLISPNPTHQNKLHISNITLPNAAWKIYNLNGQMLQSGLLGTGPNQVIDIPQHFSGCYYISFQDKNQLIVKKFVKI